MHHIYIRHNIQHITGKLKEPLYPFYYKNFLFQKFVACRFIKEFNPTLHVKLYKTNMRC